jgi:hypothetical protein
MLPGVHLPHSSELQVQIPDPIQPLSNTPSLAAPVTQSRIAALPTRANSRQDLTRRPSLPRSSRSSGGQTPRRRHDCGSPGRLRYIVL